MGYSIFSRGRPLQTDIQDLDQAKHLALHLSSSMSEWIEIRDSDNATVTIGYFDGVGFTGARTKYKPKHGSPV